MVVYKGLSYLNNPIPIPKEGKIFSWNAIESSTYNKEIAEGFKDKLMYKILIKKGTPIIPIGNRGSMGEGSLSFGEFEFTLKYGTKYYIDDVRYEVNNIEEVLAIMGG